MDTFCLLAYIPCIILIIWLLIEIRRFIQVTKKLRQTRVLWQKVQAVRSKKSSAESEHFIETIPLPHTGYTSDYYPDYASDYSSDQYSHPARRMKFRERRPANTSTRRTSYDDWAYREEIHPPARPPSTRRRRRPPPPDTYPHRHYRDRYSDDYDPRPRRR